MPDYSSSPGSCNRLSANQKRAIWKVNEISGMNFIDALKMHSLLERIRSRTIFCRSYMNLERIIERLTIIIAIVCGIIGAIYLGKQAGEGRNGVVLLVCFVVGVLGATLALKQHIWVMVPFSWWLDGTLSQLPLPFNFKEFMIMVIFGCFLMLYAFRMIRTKPVYKLRDLFMLLILIYLASVYIRNPVGTDATNSDRVGGRPYLVTAVAVLSYVILSHSSFSVSRLNLFGFRWQVSSWLIIFFVIGRCLDGLLALIAVKIPFLYAYISPIYNSGLANEATGSNANAIQDFQTGEGVERKIYLSQIASPIASTLTSVYKPTTLINPLYIIRFLLFAIAILMTLLSGYRSLFMQIGLFWILSEYIRKGWTAVVKFVAAVALGAVLIAMTQGHIVNFPLTVQRTLSFLPGNWDHLAKDDANDSTEWRTFMWKQMLTTDKYIKNKLLGDGFGFSRRDLQGMQSTGPYGPSPEDLQESFMINGNVHSGPVSTIRVIGYIGLLMLTVIFVLMARDSFRLFKATKGTPLFPFALYIGIPCALKGIYFFLIFGAVEHDLPEIIFYLGMLKMFENTLTRYQREKQVEEQTMNFDKPLLGARRVLPSGV
jgi:hypothetical protein